MDLKIYCEKKVNIISTNGKSYRGKVTDYFFPEDNDNEKESIVIDTDDGSAVEFTSDDIEKIVIM